MIMKMLKLFGIALLVLALFTACEMSTKEIKPDNPGNSVEKVKLGSSENPGDKMVTVPFKSKFYTEQEGELDFEACEGDFMALNTQVGGGNATHLGKFTTRMTFCMNFDDTAPEYLEYSGEGAFIAANGDELWFTVSGQVILYEGSEHDPFYVAYFDDEFIFEDGTGRFKGATGSGHTNSFTNFAHTDHNWTGILTLKKGS